MSLDLRLATHLKNERGDDNTPSPWPLDANLQVLLLPPPTQKNSTKCAFDEHTRQFIGAPHFDKHYHRAVGAGYLDTAKFSRYRRTHVPRPSLYQPTVAAQEWMDAMFSTRGYASYAHSTRVWREHILRCGYLFWMTRAGENRTS